MPRLAPTKGNLLAVKHSLEMARTGYELLDRKRTILINELMQLLDSVRTLRSELSQVFDAAYTALQRANLTLGYVNDRDLVAAVPVETGVSLTFHSVMGVEIPQVIMQDTPPPEMPYGISQSNHFLDEAYLAFQQVKHLTRLLTQVEIGVYRLTEEIRKTQKRSNALKNIIIPQYEETVMWINEVLEEREREEFIRLKMIKHTAALGQVSS
ncbi:MAG: V-type ATP synthase subunit D [Symbiobacteriaceae bacterium]|nr:V-type ATP synthase subunit D [Symbiobacteriaceae bacterium]